MIIYFYLETLHVIPQSQLTSEVLLICCGQLSVWINRVLNSLSPSLFTDRKADSSRPRKWSHQPPPSPSHPPPLSPSLLLSVSPPSPPFLSFCLTLSLFLKQTHAWFLNENKPSLLAVGFTLIQTITLWECTQSTPIEGSPHFKEFV